MTAPLADLTDDRFTAEQRAKLAEFHAAPVPPEVVVETVARAIFTAETSRTMPPGWTWEAEPPHLRDEYRHLAAAAIAALPPSPAEQAVKRVDSPACICGHRSSTHGDDNQCCWGDCECIDYRAALASPAPAPHSEEGQR